MSLAAGTVTVPHNLLPLPGSCSPGAQVASYFSACMRNPETTAAINARGEGTRIAEAVALALQLQVVLGDHIQALVRQTKAKTAKVLATATTKTVDGRMLTARRKMVNTQKKLDKARQTAGEAGMNAAATTDDTSTGAAAVTAAREALVAAEAALEQATARATGAGAGAATTGKTRRKRRRSRAASTHAAGTAGPTVSAAPASARAGAGRGSRRRAGGTTTTAARTAAPRARVNSQVASATVSSRRRRSGTSQVSYVEASAEDDDVMMALNFEG